MEEVIKTETERQIELENNSHSKQSFFIDGACPENKITIPARSNTYFEKPPSSIAYFSPVNALLIHPERDSFTCKKYIFSIDPKDGKAIITVKPSTINSIQN